MKAAVLRKRGEGVDNLSTCDEVLLDPAVSCGDNVWRRQVNSGKFCSKSLDPTLDNFTF